MHFESLHYTEAMERSPVDCADNGALVFSFSAYCCILLKLPSWLSSGIKKCVSLAQLPKCNAMYLMSRHTILIGNWINLTPKTRNY
jgi:hypothetical protein